MVGKFRTISFEENVSEISLNIVDYAFLLEIKMKKYDGVMWKLLSSLALDAFTITSSLIIQLGAHIFLLLGDDLTFYIPEPFVMTLNTVKQNKITKLCRLQFHSSIRIVYSLFPECLL